MTLPSVSFYLLDQAVPDGTLRTACKLTRKIVAQGYSAYVQIRDSEQAGRLDELLWTYDQGSFVPHRLEQDNSVVAPVTIGPRAPDRDPPHVLVALDGDMPEYFHLYRRIAEVVDGTDAAKELARQRYRVYRDKGCELATHEVNI